MDEYTRECLALKVGRGITSEDVIDTLSELFAMRGVPLDIRSDNGPEFIAQALRRWVKLVGVGTLYIEPGSPWESGYAESFHWRFRDEFLAMEIFEGVRDARSLTASWRDEYKTPAASQLVGVSDPGQVRRRVCGFRLGQGVGSSRTRWLPWSTLFLTPHIPWYKKSNPVRGARSWRAMS